MTMAGYSPQWLRRACSDQQHQRGADQQLVGDRIEHAAEVGLLAAAARQVAVEPVGDGGRAEQDAGGQIGSRVAITTRSTSSGIAAMRESVSRFGRSVGMRGQPTPLRCHAGEGA